jgi:hypothetical protein
MHVVLDISDHGYGHLAQIAPVADRLHVHIPNLKLTVRSRIPPETLRRFISGPFKMAPAAPEAKIHMAGPSELLVEATAKAFKDLHDNWDNVVARETEALEKLSPDILITDVTYSSLAAAKKIGLPAIGISSLNWADIYEAYCGDRAEAPEIVEQILAAYNVANAFLQLTPHLPMSRIANRQSVGPSARMAPNSHGVIRDRANLPDEMRIILVGFGGIEGIGRPKTLPKLENTVWLVEQSDHSNRPDILSLSELGMQFFEAVPDADLVVTKPGYGTIVEAACQSTRVLLQERPDWPETEFMNTWLDDVTCFASVAASEMKAGNIADAVHRLLERPLPTSLPTPSGADEAASLIADLARS